MPNTLLINRCFLLFVILIFPNLKSIAAVIEKREMQAVRTTELLKIDGNLKESAWQQATSATDFIQMEPNNGKASMYKTEVKVLYTDNAVIFGVKLHDPSPGNILHALSERDHINNSDYFSILIDPFNKGISAFQFIVTPEGIQFDAKKDKKSTDVSWDAVWKSATTIDNDGWSAEVRIPYAALRFPTDKVQRWGINFVRSVKRVNEKSSWNFIDTTQEESISQSGQLSGIENIQPPLRLSLSPYFTTYYEKPSDSKSGNFNYRGGLDLKYGVNESYTLDMMLIPDFGQVRSDDKILNLSPVEVKFDEKRQFFTESNELFTRGEVFYSRRIGASPRFKHKALQSLAEHEIITEQPGETKIINATKLSGRNTKGLAIGVFNAMTKNTYATIRDTISGKEREVKTQPFTNYNILILDQSLKNESYINLFNTNLFMPQEDYMANVSGAKLELRNNQRTYSLTAKGVVSQKYYEERPDEIGFSEFLQIQKIKGNLKWKFAHSIESEQYDINDMGYLDNNNKMTHAFTLFYQNDTPKGALLHRCSYIKLNHKTRYKPTSYSDFSTEFHFHVRFKNYASLGFQAGSHPFYQYDFYEPRVLGQKLRKAPYIYFNSWYESDSRRPLHFSARATYGNNFNSGDVKRIFLQLSPTYRFNDKFYIKHSIKWEKKNNELGYAGAEKSDDAPVVYIGNRNRTIVENSLGADYIINNKSSFNLRGRYYRATVAYKDFYELQKDGRLRGTDFHKNNDISYNSFKIDMGYKWMFAPGSELSVVWRKAIEQRNNEVDSNIIDSFKDTFDARQMDTFSIKLLYYLDYNKVRKTISS